jgi:hypothetical protein
MSEKRLTVARLREKARALELPLEDEDLARLAPMVDDLIGEARRLRTYARAAYGSEPQLERPGE